nr:MAG TPA: hypothetical protein [Caudoviricetes sp.]
MNKFNILLSLFSNIFIILWICRLVFTSKRTRDLLLAALLATFIIYPFLQQQFRFF